jgi:competence protein ComEA
MKPAKERPMKLFNVPTLKHSCNALLLSLLLMGSALAADAPSKVNINTADAATIDRVLLNIGPSKAEAIVAYRKANGPFKSIDQLALVKGVGLKTVEKNRDRIQVGAAPAKAAVAKPAAKSVAKQ